MLARIIEYLAYNRLSGEDEEIISDQAIYQHVLRGIAMRTSSRPVDMVFSVLGLVGAQITSPYHEFGEHERFRATLALVEVMLRANDDEGDGISNTLVDIPLWESMEFVDAVGLPSSDETSVSDTDSDKVCLPTLGELAQLLDNEVAEIQLSCHPNVVVRQSSMLEWTFAVERTEDDPDGKACAIALELPEKDLMDAYGGGARVFVLHEGEGIVELCRTLSEDG
ncbi:hypothetical protein D9757_007681 [Collybiopsis confluens]|uniref:Uncharacterized protein n=1 Tax=Collybiopsis confluens TaxID=2823264 RepID=A0A8H5G849_9AGAR|nr:hypothetical protein D9757_011749 [Collybiopsis confluens]KAF5379317.1 hypothetical protein D9757_007681 [Collybiopsis confluens]